MARARVVLSILLAAIGCGRGPEAARAPSRPSPSPPRPAATRQEAPHPPPPRAELRRRFVEAFTDPASARDSRARAALYAEDAVLTVPAARVPTELRGRPAIRELFDEYSRAFPDLRLGASRVLADGPVVVVQWVASGTNTGPYRGAGPTGRAVGVNGLSIAWLDRRGLVEREHVYWDETTVRSQLGSFDSARRPPAAVPQGDVEWVEGSDTERRDGRLGVYRAFHEAISRRDRDAYGALIADGATFHDYAASEDLQGRTAVRRGLDRFFAAVPDAAILRSNTWAVGAFVVAELTITGTHRGRLGGIRPTGKVFTVHAAEVVRIEGEKLTAWYRYSNDEELYGQLGLDESAR